MCVGMESILGERARLLCSPARAPGKYRARRNKAGAVNLKNVGMCG